VSEVIYSSLAHADRQAQLSFAIVELALIRQCQYAMHTDCHSLIWQRATDMVLSLLVEMTRELGVHGYWCAAHRANLVANCSLVRMTMPPRLAARHKIVRHQDEQTSVGVHGRQARHADLMKAWWS